MDRDWWLFHADEVNRVFAGERFTVAKLVHRFKVQRLTRSMFYPGGNSGIGALGLAMARGASRIVMLGYDCQWTGGRKHHHRDHPKGLGNAGSVKQWPRQFAAFRTRLDQAGVNYINCTRETALDWPHARLEDALSV